jgi:hypothetical protein
LHLIVPVEIEHCVTYVHDMARADVPQCALGILAIDDAPTAEDGFPRFLGIEYADEEFPV